METKDDRQEVIMIRAVLILAAAAIVVSTTALPPDVVQPVRSTAGRISAGSGSSTISGSESRVI